MSSKSESEESRQTVQIIGDSTSNDSSEDSKEEETTPKPSDDSPTGKVRQMANEGFDALNNALGEIESIGREENNEIKVNESTWTVQHPENSFSSKVDKLTLQEANGDLTFEQMKASKRW